MLLPGIYEEINANVLVVGDYKAFHRDHPEVAEFVDIRVSTHSAVRFQMLFKLE